jgi:divalent metal cation (Fe/Co/Zn/Cd) transporter
VAKDAVAGIPGAIGSVPDGMASAVLAGVNPIHGLYASFAGPIAGGSTASTQRMVITTTTAAALSAGSALSNVPAGDRTQALFLMTVLTGAIMIAAGLLGLGRYTRFVSISVMIGFLTGVAVNIIREGARVVWGSVEGLMDKAVEPEVQASIERTLARFANGSIRFDDSVTRRAGSRRFLDMHMHVPASWTLGRAAALRGEVADWRRPGQHRQLRHLQFRGWRSRRRQGSSMHERRAGNLYHLQGGMVHL